MKSLATPESDATILALRAAGKSFAAIADVVGCSHTTAWKRLEQIRHAGITVPAAAPAPAAPPPLTPAQKAQLPARRTCLGGCGKSFLSSSARNRICPGCRHRSENVSPFTPETF